MNKQIQIYEVAGTDLLFIITDSNLNAEYYDKNTPNSTEGALGKTIMSYGRTVTTDILTITSTRLTATATTGFASFGWKELR